MSPREVAERLIEGVTGGKWSELPDLYAENTVVTHPMAPDPGPIVGREAIRRHFAAGAALNLELTARDIALHTTTDPEVIIAEFAYEGRVRTTGREFRIPNVFILRVRDGVIVESHDYADHAALAAATGGTYQAVGSPASSP